MDQKGYTCYLQELRMTGSSSTSLLSLTYFFKWLHTSNRLAQALNNVQIHANNLFIKRKCISKWGINFFLKISYTKSVVKWWIHVNVVKVPTQASNIEESLDAKPWLGTEIESKSNVGFRYTSCYWPSASFSRSCFHVSLVICAFTCAWPWLDIAVITETWWDNLCEQILF